MFLEDRIVQTDNDTIDGVMFPVEELLFASHTLGSSRSRGHRLFRHLGGFGGRVSEERARINGLGQKAKEAWKVE